MKPTLWSSVAAAQALLLGEDQLLFWAVSVKVCILRAQTGGAASGD